MEHLSNIHRTPIEIYRRSIEPISKIYRPAPTRYDPLRQVTVRYGALRLGSHSSVLTVRLSRSDHG